MIRTLALVALAFTSTYASNEPIDFKPFTTPMIQMNERKILLMGPALADLGKRIQLECIHVTANAGGVLVTFESLPDAFQGFYNDYTNRVLAVGEERIPFASSLVEINFQKARLALNSLAELGRPFGLGHVNITHHIGGLVVRMDTPNDVCVNAVPAPSLVE